MFAAQHPLLSLSFRRCSLYLWLDGSIPPGILPWSSRHAATWTGTQSHHILLHTHPTSQSSWKASFAPSSRSPELLPVPLSFPPPPTSLLLKLCLLSLNSCFKPGAAKTLWLALSGAGREGLERREQMSSAPEDFCSVVKA